MKIAICARDRHTVSAHAGHCRHFLIYDVRGGRVGAPVMLELPVGQTLHKLAQDRPHPLDGVSALIAAGISEGLRAMLANRKILPYLTDETDPAVALARYLRGELPPPPAVGHGHSCTCAAHGAIHG